MTTQRTPIVDKMTVDELLIDTMTHFQLFNLDILQDQLTLMNLSYSSNKKFRFKNSLAEHFSQLYVLFLI